MKGLLTVMPRHVRLFRSAENPVDDLQRRLRPCHARMSRQDERFFRRLEIGWYWY
jgi:hypothetical protein